jgi:hypothetical protein
MRTTRISAADLADALWALTLLDPPPSVIDGLCRGCHPEVERERVRYELFLYRIWVADYWLLQAAAGEIHGARALVVLKLYIGLSRDHVSQAGLAEDMFLAHIDERLASYNAAQALWLEGKELEKAGGKRPPNTVLPLEEAFSCFCSVSQMGPQFVLTFVLENRRVSEPVITAIERYEIECPADDCREAEESFRNLQEKPN